MEEITKDYEISFPPCKIYLNQFSEIKEVLEKICEHVGVRTDQYLLVDIEELRWLKPRHVESI